METISATELARNTREVLDRVTRAGQPLGIERNNVLIAQLAPAQQTMNASEVLAGLPDPILSPKQARSWLKDSRGQFSDHLRDPWG